MGGKVSRDTQHSLNPLGGDAKLAASTGQQCLACEKAASDPLRLFDASVIFVTDSPNAPNSGKRVSTGYQYFLSAATVGHRRLVSRPRSKADMRGSAPARKTKPSGRGAFERAITAACPSGGLHFCWERIAANGNI